MHYVAILNYLYVIRGCSKSTTDRVFSVNKIHHIMAIKLLIIVDIDVVYELTPSFLNSWIVQTLVNTFFISCLNANFAWCCKLCRLFALCITYM